MRNFFKSLLNQSLYIGLSLVVTLAFFMLLPVLQVITTPPSKDLTIRSVDVANVPPPPPPPMEEEQKPEPEDEPPPPPALDAEPLDLAQLELALNPGGAGGFGGDFAINLGNMATGGEEVDAIFSLSDLDQKPRVVYQPAPIYPSELSKKKMEGTVYVLFVVDKDGRVKDPVVQKSTHPAFNNPALKAVRQWKFEPGKRQGKGVQFRMRVPITFQK